MIDFHSHILAGTDDGPAAVADSLAICEILARLGFTKVHCTPHIMKGVYDNHPAGIRTSVQQLQNCLHSSSFSLKLSPGAEYYADEFFPAYLEDPLLLRDRYLLMELPLYSPSSRAILHAAAILARGYIPLIAHPERTPLLAEEAPAREKSSLYMSFKRFADKNKVSPENRPGPVLAELVAMGCRFQGNLGSFAGYYGDRVRQTAMRFLDLGIYSCFGSDAHSSDRLEEFMHRGIETVQAGAGRETAARLLAGELLPDCSGN